MRATLTLLCWILLGHNPALSQTTQADAIRFVDTAKQYTSIEYSCDCFQAPEPGIAGEIVAGLQKRQAITAKYDFRTQSYLARRAISASGKNNIKIEHRSYVGDEMRGYVADNSPAFQGNSDKIPGDGVLDKIKDRNEFTGPEMLLGSPNLTTQLGERVSLASILEKLEPTVGEDGFLSIANIFQWGDFPVEFQADVKLDKTHGYLPSEIRFFLFNRIKKTRELNSVFEVTAFHLDADTNLWVPMEFNFYSGANRVFQTKTKVIPSSIRLNLNPPEEEYRLIFPESKQYVDQLTRERKLDGKVVERLGKLPQPFLTSMAPTMQIAGWLTLGCGLAGVVWFFLRKRASAAALLMLVGIAASEGCDAKRVDKEVGLAALPNPTLTIKDDAENPLVELPEGAEKSLQIAIANFKYTGFRIPIKNVSNSVIEFDEKVKTSCGCTLSKLSRKAIAPGETTYVEGQISMSNVPTMKPVQVVATISKPCYRVLNMNLNVSFVGDWTLLQEKVCLKGDVGYVTRERVELNGKPEAVHKVRYETKGDFLFQEKPSRVEGKRLFEIACTPKSLISNDVVGSVIFKSPDGVTPSQMELPVSVTGTVHSKWAPAAVLVSSDRSKEVRLVIGQGERLLRIENDTMLRLTEVVDKSTKSEKAFILESPITTDDEKTGQIFGCIQTGKVEAKLPLRFVLTPSEQ